MNYNEVINIVQPMNYNEVINVVGSTHEL